MKLTTADCIPFTIVCRVLVVVASTLVVLDALMAARLALADGDNTSGPFIVVVPLRVVDAEVSDPVFILLAIILAAVVVPSNGKLVNPSIVVILVIPSTILVIRFVVDEKLKLLVVVAAIREASEVVDTTPLTFVVITPVLVEKVNWLLEITDDVALTPLIVVVNTLPVSVVVNEFIILATLDVMPFIIVVKKLPVDVATLELIMLADDALPAITEVIVLVAEVRLFVGLGMMIEVVDITPFMLEVSVCVVVA